MIQKIREKLAQGQALYGTWSVLCSADVNELIAAGGVDFQIIDFEHGQHDVSTFANSVRACHLNSSAAMARLPGLDLAMAQRLLDAGADGLIFPQIKNFSDAEAASRLVQHTPKGVRGYNPFTRYNFFNLTSKPSTQQRPLCGIIIENKSAYDELEKILTIKDIDLVYLGIYDMSLNLGVPADYQNPQMKTFIEDCIGKCKSAGKVIGLMGPEDVLQHYAKQGVQFLVIGVDTNLIAGSVQNRLSRLR